MGTCEAIGIDLGTTNSCVAVYEHGKIKIIPNSKKHKTTPSVISFTETGLLVGEDVDSALITNHQNTIYAAKRLIGRRFNDPEVQRDIKLLPFKVVEKDCSPHIQVKRKDDLLGLYPYQVSAYVLNKMKAIAETHIGKKVCSAVVTVPANFNNGQRVATIDAARIAGFKEIKILNEPTAAAIAYGLENNTELPKKVLVFDLGGGTFDVSIVNVAENSRFEVIATTGDTHLGGDDFDRRLLQHFAAKFQQKHSLNALENPRSLSKLRIACEEAKRELSESLKASIDLDSLLNGIDFDSEITRKKFEELCDDLFQKTIDTVEIALRDQKLDESDIDDVVLVGGSTRIPRIQELLREVFKNKMLKKSINPDEAVAYGAAVFAVKCFGVGGTEIREMSISDVIPLSLGIGSFGDVMSVIISRNTSIPITGTSEFVTIEDKQKIAHLRIYEGERSIATENHLLGKFELTGLPPMPRGKAEVVVTMEIDSNGILKVSAVVTANGITNSITISNNEGKLTEEQIEGMIREAKKFAKADREHRERANARHELVSYACLVRDNLALHGSRLNAKDLKRTENAWKKALEWSDSHNAASTSEIKSKYEKLRKDCSSILSKMN